MILAHGYGSNGQDLMGLAPYLARELPDAVFVAPNAPEPIPGYAGGYQWFPLTRLDPPATLAGVKMAAPILDRFIDAELLRYGLPAGASDGFLRRELTRQRGKQAESHRRPKGKRHL